MPAELKRTGLTTSTILNYPTQKQLLKPGESLTVGDLHGNALKLLWILAYHDLIQISEKDYNDFARIYQKETFATFRGPNPRPEDLNAANINEFNEIVGRITSKNSQVFLRLIGDVLCDRGQNDYFTAILLDQINKIGIESEVLFSNHDAEFLRSLAQYDKEVSEGKIQPGAQTFAEKVRIYGISYNQAWSSGFLADNLKNGVIDEANFQKFEQAIRQQYLNQLKLVSYELSADGKEIIIYTHAPCGIAVLKSAAEKLGVEFKDGNAREIAESIDRINAEFKLYATGQKRRDGKVVSIFELGEAISGLNIDGTPATDRDASAPSDRKVTPELVKKLPLTYLSWARLSEQSHIYSDVEARPYLRVVFGHDGLGKIFPEDAKFSAAKIRLYEERIFGTDNTFGKSLEDKLGQYSYFLSDGARSKARRAAVPAKASAKLAPVSAPSVLVPAPASVVPQTQQASRVDDEIAINIAIEISSIEEQIKKIESQQFLDQTDSTLIDTLRASQQLQLKELREKQKLLQSMVAPEPVDYKIGQDCANLARLIEGTRGFYKRKIVTSDQPQDVADRAAIIKGTVFDTLDRVQNAMMTNEEVARSLDAILERDNSIAIIGRTQVGQTGNLQDVINIVNNCWDNIKTKDALVFANLDRVHFASVVVDIKNKRVIVADSLTENIDQSQYQRLIDALELKTQQIFSFEPKLREQRLQQRGDLSCAMQSFLNVLFTIQEIKKFNGANIDTTDNTARKFAGYLFGREIDESAKLSQGRLIPYLQKIYNSLDPTQKLDVDRRVLLLANINKKLHLARPIDQNLLMATVFDNSVRTALTTIRNAMEDDIIARTPQGADWKQTPKHPGTNDIGKLAVAIDRRDRLVAELQAQNSISNSVDVRGLEKTINELNQQIASSEIYKEFMAIAKSRQLQTQIELGDAHDDEISAVTSRSIIMQFFNNHQEYSDLANVVLPTIGLSPRQQTAAASAPMPNVPPQVQRQPQLQQSVQQQPQLQVPPQHSQPKSRLAQAYLDLKEFNIISGWTEENGEENRAHLVFDIIHYVYYGVLKKPDGTYAKVKQKEGQRMEELNSSDEEFFKVLDILKNRLTRSDQRYKLFEGLSEVIIRDGPNYKEFVHKQKPYRIYENGYIAQEIPHPMNPNAPIAAVKNVEYEKAEYLEVIKAAREYCKQLSSSPSTSTGMRSGGPLQPAPLGQMQPPPA